jgi:hypothetical protein
MGFQSIAAATTFMLKPETWKDAVLPDDKPVLVVIVDTEEEFDWAQPLAPGNTAVSAMRAQHRAHRIFGKFGIRPTYVLDYPVASQPEGSRPLAELQADGLCDIGAHLHPWVNPPHDEPVCNFNSYPGNLPPALERAKLARLGEAIEAAFGRRPTVYKAGRYGVGAATTGILEELGYLVDTSVLSQTDLRPREGPDFSACGPGPYWFGRNRRLLEVPMTVGFAGLLRGHGRSLYAAAASPAGMRMHVPGILARTNLLERITLTPEGVSHDEHRRLTAALLAAGNRVFSFTYHSPSLAPGHTPYVRNEAELGRFLDQFERYFDYFFGELGGRTATARELRDSLAATTPDGY